MKQDITLSSTDAHRLLSFIRGQVISEKAYRLGENENQYVFSVPVSTNKQDIKSAIEYLFEVKVSAVNTLTTKKKSKRFKNIPGQRSNFKKAYVSLEKGQKLNISFND